MEAQQVACPSCGSVSTLDRCWVGMQYECENCRHRFNISADDICLDPGAEKISAAVDTVPVSYTCPTCGAKQQTMLPKGEKFARCSICSSMADVSSFVNVEPQAAAPAVDVAPQLPVSLPYTAVTSSQRSGAVFKVCMMSFFVLVLLAGGGTGIYYFLNKVKSDNTSSSSSSGKTSGKSDSKTSSVSARGSDLKSNIKRVSPSVVCVEVTTKKGTFVGSGFAVTDKYIITNRHVVEGARGVRIGNPLWKKKVFDANIIEISQDYDLAWIEVDDDSFTLKPMNLYNGSLLDQGEKVYTLGYPGYSYEQSKSIPQMTVAEGIIKSNNRVMDSNPCYESSAIINGGNSGGPLVNEKFQVVGVNTFKMKAEYAEGCFYSVTVETIKLAFPELWQKISGK